MYDHFVFPHRFRSDRFTLIAVSSYGSIYYKLAAIVGEV